MRKVYGKLLAPVAALFILVSLLAFSCSKKEIGDYEQEDQAYFLNKCIEEFANPHFTEKEKKEVCQCKFNYLRTKLGPNFNSNEGNIALKDSLEILDCYQQVYIAKAKRTENNTYSSLIQ